jgi:hypothetical protein
MAIFFVSFKHDRFVNKTHLFSESEAIYELVTRLFIIHHNLSLNHYHLFEMIDKNGARKKFISK